MRTRAIFVGTVLTAAIVAVFAAQPGAQGGQYSFIKEIKIGGDGGWDYLKDFLAEDFLVGVEVLLPWPA